MRLDGVCSAADLIVVALITIERAVIDDHFWADRKGQPKLSPAAAPQKMTSNLAS